MTTYHARPVGRTVLKELRDRDDAGLPPAPFTDDEGGAPLRCCLRRSRAAERLALVSYAPLRRWAAENSAAPGAYDEQGPVFIHADECPGPMDGDGRPDGGYPLGAPGALRTVRRYGYDGHILGGSLLEIPGPAEAAFDERFAEAFADPAVALVHVRAVEYGCFLYEVRRD